MAVSIKRRKTAYIVVDTITVAVAAGLHTLVCLCTALRLSCFRSDIGPISAVVIGLCSDTTTKERTLSVVSFYSKVGNI